MCSTPVKGGTFDGVLQYHDESGRARDDSFGSVPPPPPPADWTRLECWTDKYVDDANCGERHYLPHSTHLISTGKEKRIIRVSGYQSIFKVIKENASKIAMHVNDKKTQLVCLSGHSHLKVQSFIKAGDLTISSQQSLKILGFVLGDDCSMNANVMHISKSFYMRLWRLRHLKRTGICDNDLVKIYVMMLRPVIEYAVQVYGPMLTLKQSETIESMQRTTLKIIFGTGVSYGSALTRANIESLEERRKGIVKKFAIQSFENPRYAHWFPRTTPTKHDLRKKRTVKETRPRTERMINSPIYQFSRKIINDL